MATEQNNEKEIIGLAIKASDETEPLWTVRDVATYLRLKPGTVRAMARRGELPCLKVGTRVWRFRPKEVKDWVNLQKEP